MVATLDLDSLNPQQREAVEWPGGPLQIFAGAGSGKTRVITYRIAKLIEDGCRPSRIMSVTFTNKAAKEMRERLESLIGSDARDLWMGTFHSTCAKLLRMHGEEIGLSRDFVIYDDGDQVGLVKDLLRRLDIDEKTTQPRGVLHEISRAKERLESPEKYAEFAAGYLEKTVSKVYALYQRELKKANALDFDDILMLAVELLEKSTEVRERLQERFLHVLIDEYQDVNFAQYRFAQLMTGKHRNITIVGDDDQSIYSWRGADVSLMLRFSSDYKDAKVITLAQNYRSTQRILSAAYDVIRHNKGRAEKQLWTSNTEGAPLTVSEAGTDSEEAMVVADSIVNAVRANRRSYGEYGILYRTNAQSRVLEEAFVTMRIPHVLIGGQRFYERKEIKDMIAYLRLLLNPVDGVSLKRVLNVPARGIGAGTLSVLEDWAVERNLTIWDAARDQAVQSQIMRKALTGINQFLGILDEGREMMETAKVTELLTFVMKASGYLDMLKADRTEESIARMENLQELLQVTQTFDGQEEEGGLAGFLENISLIADTDNLTDSGEAVTLMTMHSSKGLEFPVVFVVGLEEGVFPHSRSIGNEKEMEEERRLCYVAMTRAREELHLLHAERRSMFGTANFNRRSRFLDDIQQEGLSSLVQRRTHNVPGLQREVRSDRTGQYRVVDRPMPSSDMAVVKKPDWKAPFEIGQRVSHVKFGEGVVISCSPLKGNDAEVSVAFPGITGVKKLVQSLAKLEAV